MNTEHSGRESIESIDQSGDAHEQNPETTITHGEAAGGEEADVPGGATTCRRSWPRSSATRRRCTTRGRTPGASGRNGDWRTVFDGGS